MVWWEIPREEVYTMSSTQIVILVIVLVVLALLAVGAVFMSRRQALRRRFGPEYDRVVSEKESRSDAERELRDRQRRYAELEIRDLDPFSRQRYVAAWEETQARFLDAPQEAVGQADKLVTQLMAERGYPTGDFDERVGYLSVEHAATLDHYRKARDISVANDRGQASTEDLRQALVHYRALFADLLGTEPVRQPESRSDSDGTRSSEGQTDASRQ
jgi:hypothetical protein